MHTLGAVFAAWRDHVGRAAHLREVAETVDDRRAVRLLRTGLRAWRAAWKDRVRDAEANAVAYTHRDRSLKRVVFAALEKAVDDRHARDAAAFVFYRTHGARKVFRAWHQIASSEHKLRRAAATAEATTRDRLLSKYWAAWTDRQKQQVCLGRDDSLWAPSRRKKNPLIPSQFVKIF